MQIKRWFILSVSLVLIAFSSGCATYVAHVAPGVEPERKQRIYVINNLDDNHRIDLMLVAALKAEGKDAESGPPTMIPDHVDALIGYRDHWSWDFTDHLVALSIELRGPISKKAIASADYVSPASLRTPPETVVTKLVYDLMHQHGRPVQVPTK